MSHSQQAVAVAIFCLGKQKQKDEATTTITLNFQIGLFQIKDTIFLCIVVVTLYGDFTFTYKMATCHS